MGLFLSSTTYVVTNKIYYVVQFPAAFGTSERAIHMLLRRLDILGGVAKSLNVRTCEISVLVGLTHPLTTAGAKRRCARLARMALMWRAPPC